MLRRRHIAALALAALPLLSARVVPDGKADFTAALAQVQKLLDGHRWKDAKALLGTTLEAHVDQAYVRERLDTVRAMTTLCAFELAHPDKGVKGILCGEVADYDPKTGAIELRWERAQASKGRFPCDDFESTPQGYVLRMPFDGPHSIELSGKELGQKIPYLLGCVEGERYYEASLDAGSGNEITRVEGEARKSVGSTTTIFNVARPYVLKLAVRANQIEASHNKARLIQVEKAKDEFGRVGFRAVFDPQKIVVTGKARRTWIDEQVEALRKKEREEFDKTYAVEADLPAWLRKG